MKSLKDKLSPEQMIKFKVVAWFYLAILYLLLSVAIKQNFPGWVFAVFNVAAFIGATYWLTSRLPLMIGKGKDDKK